MSFVSSSVRSCWSLACSGCVKPSCGRAIHDEEATLAEQSAAARRAGQPTRHGRDWYSFTVRIEPELAEAGGGRMIRLRPGHRKVTLGCPAVPAEAGVRGFN